MRGFYHADLLPSAFDAWSRREVKVLAVAKTGALVKLSMMGHEAYKIRVPLDRLSKITVHWRSAELAAIIRECGLNRDEMSQQAITHEYDLWRRRRRDAATNDVDDDEDDDEDDAPTPVTRPSWVAAKMSFEMCTGHRREATDRRSTCR